jgi:nucleoside phosphorylase
MSTLLRTHEDYQIGIICALAHEKAAVEAMLDEEHPRLKRKEHDVNDYTLGRIGVHNVAIACLPAGLLGNGPAAIVAKDMECSFPIKFGLIVGIGGGVWSKKADLRLGMSLSVNLKGHMVGLCNGISERWRREVYSGGLEH